MKILLVSPEARVWNSRTHIHNGLGYLAGSLLAAGYETDIYDGAVEDESLDARLTREPFDIVGISSPTPLIDEAWQYARIAKQHHAVTILGGPHLTLMPDESMQKPEVDFVARGEAEGTIVEFVRAVESLTPAPSPNGRGEQRPFAQSAKGGDEVFKPIKGLSWKDAEGKVRHNVDRPLNPDLDAIPLPAYHLFKINRYTNLQPLTDGLDRHARSYTIVTSRGCPYKCTYCSKPITGDTWRARSVENVIREWKMLVEDLGATEIGVTDDIWNLNLKRAKELCQALIDNGLNKVPWVTVHGMKVNHTDAELFQLMKRAGCKRVGFGVESGDEDILKRVVKKSQTFDQVRAAFKNAKAAGLQTMGFFIYGMPGETAETMDKTTQLALELDPDLAHFMIASPYPGTVLWDTVQREGKLYAHAWRDLAIQSDHAHFDFPGMDPKLVEQKWHEAYRRFYFRPKRLLKRLTSADTWRNMPERVRDAQRFFVAK
jgi:anaerobic magnesium-protoporphyrin IX monomethyl ester cyclase